MRKLSFFIGVFLLIGLFTSCEKEVEATGISLDKTTLTSKIGDLQVLTATVLPADATNKSVTWASSNPIVASAVDGIVTPLTTGTATIMAKAGNYTATCEVTVINGLEGTTWKGTWDDSFTVKFVDGVNCTATEYDGYFTTTNFSGTYTFVSQNISFTITSNGFTTYVFYGKVSGNTMNLNVGSKAVVLTKQ